ncbi:MAG: prepilin-type N-terminal cleavage/methylation domain-containing protein [bacterium]
MKKYLTRPIKSRAGFTLIEVIFSIAIFSIVAMAIYQGYAKLVEGSNLLRIKAAAIDLANEQFEIAHNLPYSSVGLINGVPSGTLSRFQTLTRNNLSFLITTTIRNIDDAFDGQVGSSTRNDTSPADYKLMEVEVTCTSCKNFQPLIYSSFIAPKNLEQASTNGSLFINVFDATGISIADANVHIENNASTPKISIDEVTNSSGQVQIVDTPPSAQNYEITVSKSGYSTEKTYKNGATENPYPSKPHSTVSIQQLTKISFSIDKTSQLQLTTLNSSCNPIGSVPLKITGTKIIGTNPTVYKFNQPYTTDASGSLNLSNMEWDSYNFNFSSSTYDLIGTNPLWPVFISPSSTVSVFAILASKNPNRLIVTVKDNVTGLAITDARVTLTDGNLNYIGQKISGRGYLSQTDWSGGDGQVSYANPAKFYSFSSGINYATAGQISLVKSFGYYLNNGNLESSTFDTQILPQYNQILWVPNINTASTTIKAQMAFADTDTATTTWSFIGPDDTAASYFTIDNQNIPSSSSSGKRYFRYKIFLTTTDTKYTPTLNDLYITYTYSCAPSGQVSFGGLTLGSYNILIEKDGYQSSTKSISLSSPWQEAIFNLMQK